MYKSIIEGKRRKKHDEMVLLAKNKLNKMEVIISKSLTDSYFSHDNFTLINNVLRVEIKEKIRNHNSK